MRTFRPNDRSIWLAAMLFIVTVSACAQADPVLETGPMGTMDHSDGNEHEHGAAEIREWDGDEQPAVWVSISGGNDTGWMIRTEVSGFTVSGPESLDHVPGEGHVHLFIDGELHSMIFEPELRIPELSPGVHEVMVQLGSNDHRDYVIRGEPLVAMTTIEVEGIVAAADLTVSVTVDGGGVTVEPARPEARLGAVVEVTVDSDVADEVHVHGYDLIRRVRPDRALTFRFEADVPGVFEVELEGSGLGLFALEVR